MSLKIKAQVYLVAMLKLDCQVCVNPCYELMIESGACILVCLTVCKCTVRD